MPFRRHALATAFLSAFILAACGGDDPDSTPGAAAPADQPAPGAAQGIDPDLMALMTEAQELQTRIAPARDQALEDQELASHLAELQDRINDALRESSGELVDEMDGLEAEFESAQATGDEGRMQEIAMQAQTVQMQLQSAQEEILDRPDIRDDIEAFETRHREVMLEIDPDLEEALDRLEEIMERLQAAAP
ncbi:MAG: hypothetical protein EA422_07485 [Gemmatimonadales bacterium]|nr:MAG: hypothetical protein EA422_07485 [Gemmatimonadales bacterium]